MNSPEQVGRYHNLRPAASTVVSLTAGMGIPFSNEIPTPAVVGFETMAMLVGFTLVAILCPIADRRDALIYNEKFTKADALCSSLRGILLAGFGYFVGGVICLIMFF